MRSKTILNSCQGLYFLVVPKSILSRTCFSNTPAPSWPPPLPCIAPGIYRCGRGRRRCGSTSGSEERGRHCLWGEGVMLAGVDRPMKLRSPCPPRMHRCRALTVTPPQYIMGNILRLLLHCCEGGRQSFTPSRHGTIVASSPTGGGLGCGDPRRRGMSCRPHPDLLSAAR
jgi:hypothetical protein